jgi:hypothetical protein
VVINVSYCRVLSGILRLTGNNVSSCQSFVFLQHAMLLCSVYYQSSEDVWRRLLAKLRKTGHKLNKCACLYVISTNILAVHASPTLAQQICEQYNVSSTVAIVSVFQSQLTDIVA